MDAGELGRVSGGKRQVLQRGHASVVRHNWSVTGKADPFQEHESVHSCHSG